MRRYRLVSQFDLVRTMGAQEDGTVTGAPLTADPLLAPLASNGGPSQTMALRAGSPAIDATRSGCLPTDQRGAPRPDNRETVCDIGAYEVQDTPAGDTTATGTGTPGGGGVIVLAAIGRETLSPSAFPAAPSGPSAVAAKRRRYGSKVTCTLNQPAVVRFTVVDAQPGRKSKGGRCVKPTRANHRAPRCLRWVTLRGSFTRSGTAGSNTFRFTGRLSGRRLTAGRYRLVATPSAGGRTGPGASASFRIIR